MERPFRRHTADDVRSATTMAQRVVNDLRRMLRKYEADDQADQRAHERECKTCFYLRRGRIAGAAMTRWFCGICGDPQMASSTHTGKVCRDCAGAHNLCTNCGGSYEA